MRTGELIDITDSVNTATTLPDADWRALDSIFPEFDWGNPVTQCGDLILYAGRIRQGDAFCLLLAIPPDQFSSPTAAEAFVQSMAKIQAVQHPGLLGILGVAGRAGGACVAYEWFPGGSLDGFMQHTKIPAGLAVFMVATVADALHATHQAGICHRDVNPAWILLDANGNAKLVGAGLTYFLYVTNDAFVMSLMRRRAHLRSYLAPEQLDPDLPTDYLADIYSLGAIVYHLLVGNPPGGLTVLPSSRGEVGQGTDDVVLKSLHRDPHSRYKTAKAFGDEVRRIGGAIDNSRWWQWQQNLATTESTKARKVRRFSRKTVIIAIASCLFFGVGIFLFVKELVADTKLSTEQLTKSISSGIVSQEKREEALAVMASIVHKAVKSTWDGSHTDAVEQSARVAVMTGNQTEVVDLARLCLDKIPPRICRRQAYR